jgi:hypothetical protein
MKVDAKKIRLKARQKGVSLREVSENVNMARSAFYNMLREGRTQRQTVEALSKYFEVAPEFFVLPEFGMEFADESFNQEKMIKEIVEKVDERVTKIMDEKLAKMFDLVTTISNLVNLLYSSQNKPA